VKRRYIVAPQATRDIASIWQYLKDESSSEAADRVESVIRGKFVYLADFPNAGHYRRDLTSIDVRFFSIYSYLIVYRPETRPLQIVAILHGRRDVAKLLPKRTES
jgi:antitoxin ParD1/3/4